MKNLLIIILLVAVAGLGWILYQQQLQTQQQITQITQLTQRLSQVEFDVTAVRNRVRALDKSSINGLVEEANNAILDGWEALVNGVGEEVKRVRESIQQSIPEPLPESIPDSQPPQLESPNGLDKT
jgi:methyl-accepting chemotaxis protein